MGRKIFLAFWLAALVMVMKPLAGLGESEGDYSLKGRIINEREKPLNGVIISSPRYPYPHAITDERGEFSLKVPFPLKAWELVVSHFAYPSVQLTLPFTQQELNMQLKPELPEGEKGGSRTPVEIEADRFFYEQEGDFYRASGQVVINFKGDRMTAEEVVLSRAEDKLIASGRVVVKAADGDVLEGDRMEVKISTKTGNVERGQIFIYNTHFYLRGNRLEKRSEVTYYGDRVEATTCDGDSPDWWVTGKNLAVTMEGYGTLKHGCFYAKNVPLLYSPYLIFPVKTKRQTGFLLPHRLAYSKDRLGMDLGIPFFWAISEDKDATFYQRFMSERGFQEGVEFRHIAEKSQGTVYAEFLQDRKKISEEVSGLSRNWQDGRNRWALYINQENYFREDFYLRVDLARVSDRFYFKDFTSYNYFLANFKEDRAGTFQKVDFYGNESLPYLDSILRLHKKWEKYNLTLLMKNTQDLSAPSDTNTLQKYPEIGLMGIKQPLGRTPLWFDVSGTYDQYYREAGHKGHLFDITPALYLPLYPWRYVRFSPLVALRIITWSRTDNLNDGERQTDHREVYITGASLNTELNRTFSWNEKKGQELKHTIYPEILYLYSPAPTGGNVPTFVPATSPSNPVSSTFNQIYLYASSVNTNPTLTGNFHLVSYSLTNLLTWKEVQSGKMTQHDFLRLKLAQYYDVREARRDGGKPFSDLFAELDIYPYHFISLSARNRYDVYETHWREEKYSATLRDKRGDTGTLAYRYTNDGVKEVNLNFKAVVEKSLDLRLYFRRDLINDRDIEKGVGIDYRRQCWSVGFDYGESMNDRVFSIRFSLLGL